MLITLTVSASLRTEKIGFEDSSGSNLSRTSRLLAYALQPNRPRNLFAKTPKLETAEAQGKTLTKSAPALCADITSVGINAPGFPEEEQHKHHARQLENSSLEPLIPEHKTIAIPRKYLQPVTAAQTEQKVAPAERVFSYRCTHPLGQRRSNPQRMLVASTPSQMRAPRSIRRSQARQTDHASTSSTASNARK